jgi:hypothetical protein
MENLTVTVITRVRPETAERINGAARRADQPVSAWLRIIIMRELDRLGPESLRHEAGHGGRA